MEHLNIHISHIPLKKQQKNTAEERNKKKIYALKITTFALHELDQRISLYKVDNCI